MKGNNVIFFLIFLIILGSLVFSSGWWILKSNPEWGVYIMTLSGFFVVGVVGMFWLKENIKIKLIKLLFASFLTLFITDQFLLYLDRSEIYKSAQTMGINFDRRDQLEFIEDLKNKGEQTYLMPTPFNFLQYTWNKVDVSNFFPLGGKPKATTVYCNAGMWTTYKSDRFGFNNNDSVYDLESSAVVLIGDSFVHGVCVPQEKNIAGVLRQKGFKAISLGVGGQGPLTQLASLVEYGRFFKPKIVVWFYLNETNFEFLKVEKKYPILLKYLSSDFSQGLIEKNDFLDNFWDEFNEQRITEAKFIKYKNFLTLSKVREYLDFSVSSSSKAGNEYLNNDIADSQNQWILLENIFKQAKVVTEEAGGKFYLVTLVTNPIYGKDLSRKYDLMKKLMKKLQIPIIDMKKHLESYDNPAELFYLNQLGEHYNEKGYKLVADLIEQKGWLESVD
jgi:hypothetical protein